MTEALQALRDEAAAAAKAAPGKPVVRDLVAKGTTFGSIAAMAAANGTVTFDVSKVQGVDPDLVIRPMDWKGDVTNLRTFSAVVSMRAMGMQPEEMVWRVPAGAKNPDLDGDGVVRELSVGDVTAMTDRQRSRRRPSSRGSPRWATCRRRPPSRRRSSRRARRGVYASAAAACHTPENAPRATRLR
jgi:hypothetical protein